MNRRDGVCFLSLNNQITNASRFRAFFGPHLILSTYIYNIYIYTTSCILTLSPIFVSAPPVQIVSFNLLNPSVCVCERERNRERDKEKERE